MTLLCCGKPVPLKDGQGVCPKCGRVYSVEVAEPEKELPKEVTMTTRVGVYGCLVGLVVILCIAVLSSCG